MSTSQTLHIRLRNNSSLVSFRLSNVIYFHRQQSFSGLPSPERSHYATECSYFGIQTIYSFVTLVGSTGIFLLIRVCLCHLLKNIIRLKIYILHVHHWAIASHRHFNPSSMQDACHLTGSHLYIFILFPFFFFVLQTIHWFGIY